MFYIYWRSQILVTALKFELEIPNIQWKSLTHWTFKLKRLDWFKIPKFTVSQQEYLIYFEILQIGAKFDTLDGIM